MVRKPNSPRPWTSPRSPACRRLPAASPGARRIASSSVSRCCRTAPFDEERLHRDRTVSGSAVHKSRAWLTSGGTTSRPTDEQDTDDGDVDDQNREPARNALRLPRRRPVLDRVHDRSESDGEQDADVHDDDRLPGHPQHRQHGERQDNRDDNARETARELAIRHREASMRGDGSARYSAVNAAIELNTSRSSSGEARKTIRR